MDPKTPPFPGAACSDQVRVLLDQVPAGMCRFEVEPPIPIGEPLATQVMHLGTNSRLVECNDLMAKMHGRAGPAKILGTRLGEVILSSTARDPHPLEAFVRSGYLLSNLQSREPDRDGNVRELLNNLAGVVEDGALVRIWASSRDVTEFRRAEADAQRLAAFTSENPNPVLEADAAGFVVYQNAATDRLLKQLGVDLTDLLPPNHADLVRACLASQEEPQGVELAVRDRVFSWTYFPVASLGMVHLFATDITSRKHAEQRLQYDALHDTLTKLPNRALLMDRLERAAERMDRHPKERFAVLFLDLDRFKNINDSLGHSLGDQLLEAVAWRLDGCARTADTVARLGGDEFVILQQDVHDAGDASRLAERLLEALAQAFPLDPHEVFTSASIGIAISSASYHQPEDLIRNADTAMFRAKAQGGGRYEVFDREMHDRAVRTLRTETELRQALVRGELCVYYQPIVAAKTAELIAVEALSRWQHPLRGLVLPGEYIPIAEDTGLIEGLGRFTLEASCAQVRRWREQGWPAARVSVNLSGRQFQQHDLGSTIREALVRAGLPPDALKLEITESVAAQDPESVVRVLEELRALGVQILIDDFGTGYSSLSHLQHLPIDAIKIDRSFVCHLDADSAATAIVHAVISMAHALGFEVIAEGVETEAQARYLRERGCDALQGYLFGRPEPAEALARFFKKP